MSNKRALGKSDYFQFLKEIKEKITSARITAYRKLNKELINLYWDIGKLIFERQQRFSWGRSVVEQLAKDLHKDYPATEGFSARNLWDMRRFYIEYKDCENLRQLVAEIPWGQNLVIMSRIKNMQEREFYIRATIRSGWSRNVLIHQIEAEAYKYAKAKKMHNFPKALSPYLAEQADLAVKDRYMLDFLDLNEPLQEREMNRKLVAHLKDFLTELGLGFCFIGSQYPVRLKDKEYYIDLLFFHNKDFERNFYAKTRIMGADCGVC